MTPSSRITAPPPRAARREESLQLLRHAAEALEGADGHLLAEAGPLHAQQDVVGAGLLAVAADLLDQLALAADQEAAAGELVEVGADAVGRHEARIAAPARIGLVLERQRLAHLVERAD